MSWLPGKLVWETPFQKQNLLSVSCSPLVSKEASISEAVTRDKGRSVICHGYRFTHSSPNTATSGDNVTFRPLGMAPRLSSLTWS